MAVEIYIHNGKNYGSWNIHTQATVVENIVSTHTSLWSWLERALETIKETAKKRNPQNGIFINRWQTCAGIENQLMARGWPFCVCVHLSALPVYATCTGLIRLPCPLCRLQPHQPCGSAHTPCCPWVHHTPPSGALSTHSARKHRISIFIHIQY